MVSPDAGDPCSSTRTALNSSTTATNIAIARRRTSSASIAIGSMLNSPVRNASCGIEPGMGTDRKTPSATV